MFYFLFLEEKVSQVDVQTGTVDDPGICMRAEFLSIELTGFFGKAL